MTAARTASSPRSRPARPAAACPAARRPRSPLRTSSSVGSAACPVSSCSATSSSSSPPARLQGRQLHAQVGEHRPAEQREGHDHARAPPPRPARPAGCARPRRPVPGQAEEHGHHARRVSDHQQRDEDLPEELDREDRAHQPISPSACHRDSARGARDQPLIRIVRRYLGAEPVAGERPVIVAAAGGDEAERCGQGRSRARSAWSCSRVVDLDSAQPGGRQHRRSGHQGSASPRDAPRGCASTVTPPAPRTSSMARSRIERVPGHVGPAARADPLRAERLDRDWRSRRPRPARGRCAAGRPPRRPRSPRPGPS